MKTREHHDEPIQPPTAAAGPAASGGNLNTYRVAGQQLFDVAHGAIEKGLSGDSLKLNQAVDQEEGQ